MKRFELLEELCKWLALEGDESLILQRASLEAREEFEKGDFQAILDFAKEFSEAIRERWVAGQIVKWREEDTAESRRKLRALMRSYSDFRGKSPSDVDIELLKRDLKIFEAVMEKKDGNIPLGTCYEEVSEELASEEEILLDAKSIQEIYLELYDFFNRLMAHFPPLLRAYPFAVCFVRWVLHELPASNDKRRRLMLSRRADLRFLSSYLETLRSDKERRDALDNWVRKWN